MNAVTLVISSGPGLKPHQHPQVTAVEGIGNVKTKRCAICGKTKVRVS